MGWIADLLQEIPSAARYKSELEAMEKKVVSLEAENANLRQEIQRRDDAIQKEKSQSDRLEEVREKLLQLLASQTRRITASQAAQALKIGEQLATYHLTEMEKNHLVSAAHFYDDHPTDYSIAQSGRAYLVAHELLR